MTSLDKLARQSVSVYFKWIGRPVNLVELIIVMTVTWEWFFPPREKKNLSCLCMWELTYKLTLTGLYLRNVTNACTRAYTHTHAHKFPNLHCVQVNKPLLCHQTVVGDTIYHHFNKISKFFIIRIRTWSTGVLFLSRATIGPLAHQGKLFTSTVDWTGMWKTSVDSNSW